MRQIKSIILHCSALEYGDSKQIKEWHLKRGFLDIGYHFVILNGKRTKDDYTASIDGKIETGRPIEQTGAHCPPNKNSIGICLIGNKDFTFPQYNALQALIERLRERFGLIEVKGHYEMPSGKKQGKTCPNIDMTKLRTEWKLWV